MTDFVDDVLALCDDCCVADKMYGYNVCRECAIASAPADYREWYGALQWWADNVRFAYDELGKVQR